MMMIIMGAMIMMMASDGAFEHMFSGRLWLRKTASHFTSPSLGPVPVLSGAPEQAGAHLFWACFHRCTSRSIHIDMDKAEQRTHLFICQFIS